MSEALRAADKKWSTASLKTYFWGSDFVIFDYIVCSRHCWHPFHICMCCSPHVVSKLRVSKVAGYKSELCKLSPYITSAVLLHKKVIYLAHVYGNTAVRYFRDSQLSVASKRSSDVCLFVTMRPAGTRCICELYWHNITSFNNNSFHTIHAPVRFEPVSTRDPTATHHLSLPGLRYKTLLTTCQTSSPSRFDTWGTIIGLKLPRIFLIPSSSSQLTQYQLARRHGIPKQNATVSVESVLKWRGGLRGRWTPY
jgi:hypothetical protein